MLKTYIAVFTAIFVVLIFLTWQQISIFRLGYKITKLKKEINVQEIKRQCLIKKMLSEYSMKSIESKAITKFKMSIPEMTNRKLLVINKNRLPASGKKKKITTLTLYIKELFDTKNVQAK